MCLDASTKTTPAAWVTLSVVSCFMNTVPLCGLFFKEVRQMACGFTAAETIAEWGTHDAVSVPFYYTYILQNCNCWFPCLCVCFILIYGSS